MYICGVFLNRSVSLYILKKSRGINWFISRNNIVPAPISAPKKPTKK